MRYQVTQEQIDQYQRDGFIVIENFLDPQELERWRNDVDEAIEQRLATENATLTNKDSEEYYRSVFLQCLRLADTHPGVHELMFDPRLGEVAGRLAGVDGIRIWHDQALVKQPFGNPTAWHVDNPYWSFSSPNSLSIWVALDDATMSNGCLYYLPGTHKLAHYKTADIGPNLADLFKVYPEWKSIDPIACPCPAGSAVFHNGLTAHGAGANMTNKPRRAMTCAYMPDGATFNGVQNILPTAYFESLTVGDKLDEETQNPLIWFQKR
jgi:phytanoyl-CoA hydroxylase